MPDPDYCHIVFLLDRSGSMQAIRDDTIGGFNTFLEQQRKLPGRCTLTLVQFDSQAPRELVHDTVPLAEVPPLTEATFVPRANTPLLDSLGWLIQHTGRRLAALDEPRRPGRVVFVILTDGLENASYRYRRAQVFDMVTHQQTKYRWQFLYLGANQDAIGEGWGLGIAADHSLEFSTAPGGPAGAFRACNRLLIDFRTADPDDPHSIGITPAERHH